MAAFPPRGFRRHPRGAAALVAAALTASASCGGAGPAKETSDLKEKPAENWTRNSVHTALSIDVEKREGTARIELGPSERPGASLEAEGLEILEVSGPGGEVPHRIEAGRLDLAARAGEPLDVTVRYRFADTDKFEGSMRRGMTFTWPYFCKNLFPCRSDPADGLTFELELSGVPEGELAVYPRRIDFQAPPYMLAWAIGEYTYVPLGVTAAGTKVGAYHLPGDEDAIAEGTDGLVAAFEWLETTLGPYGFGDEVASVSADWGPGGYGGMEHHPYWHVARGSLRSREVHAHEAAHGWFGDGVRIACWEDLTLSEGVTSYLAARAVEAAHGEEAGAETWADYEKRLASAVAGEDRVAWPSTCGGIDVLEDLFGTIPYMKGAFFLRAVEGEVGRPALDRALSAFYVGHRGEAAGVADLLAAIERETGFDPSGLAEDWLRSLGRPE